MPDATRPSQPQDWPAAFAALPLDAAPADGWPRVAARLDARRRRRRLPLWLATAAALVLAVALPWQLRRDAAVLPTSDTAVASATTGATTPDPLRALQSESARLEAFLRLARDERVSSASAAALAGELDDRVAGIDAALMQPQLSGAQQVALWQNRVDALRTVAGFEGTRRWLVANGSRYDGAVVHID